MDNSCWCCRRARGHHSFFLSSLKNSSLFLSIHRISASKASMARAWWCWRRSTWSTFWAWNSAQPWSFDRSWWSTWMIRAVPAVPCATAAPTSRRTWWTRRASSTTSQKCRFHAPAALTPQSFDCGAFTRFSNPTFWKQKRTSFGT